MQVLIVTCWAAPARPCLDLVEMNMRVVIQNCSFFWCCCCLSQNCCCARLALFKGQGSAGDETLLLPPHHRPRTKAWSLSCTRPAHQRHSLIFQAAPATPPIIQATCVSSQLPLDVTSRHGHNFELALIAYDPTDLAYGQHTCSRADRNCGRDPCALDFVSRFARRCGVAAASSESGGQSGRTKGTAGTPMPSPKLRTNSVRFAQVTPSPAPLWKGARVLLLQCMPCSIPSMEVVVLRA